MRDRLNEKQKRDSEKGGGGGGVQVGKSVLMSRNERRIKGKCLRGTMGTRCDTVGTARGWNDRFLIILSQLSFFGPDLLTLFLRSFLS